MFANWGKCFMNVLKAYTLLGILDFILCPEYCCLVNNLINHSVNELIDCSVNVLTNYSVINLIDVELLFLTNLLGTYCLDC